MKTRTSISVLVVGCLLCGIAIGIMLSRTGSGDEARLARLESRILSIESDPLIAGSAQQRAARQFAERQLRQDVANLQIHTYGFSRANGRMTVLKGGADDISLEGYELHFGLWRSEDREKSRASLTVRIGKNGRFEMALPPGEYRELQFCGGSLPEGFAFTHAGYPLRDVTIVRDGVVELPPIEISRKAK
jgi:hypothetical protein